MADDHSGGEYGRTYREFDDLMLDIITVVAVMAVMAVVVITVGINTNSAARIFSAHIEFLLIE
jgi:hypothetical protein